MNKTKYFLDTEFIEDGKTIDLISIGIVTQDGRSLYLQNSQCDFTKASDWVWRNVFPHLLHFDMRGRRACDQRSKTYDSGLGQTTFTSCSDDAEKPCPWATRREIRDRIIEFCSHEKYGIPEFWGYYADYDWVAFCQLFGAMIDLQSGYPMYCRDLKQWADQLGVNNLNLQKPESEIHHALSDAEWVKEAYEILAAREQNETPRIYSLCPACGCSTLTINKGRLLCTWHACPNPTLIDRKQ